MSECTQIILQVLFATTTNGLRLAQSRLGVHRSETSRPASYHRLPTVCCTRAGETEGGGLDKLMPVTGLTIGIGFRGREAEGWWSFKGDC